MKCVLIALFFLLILLGAVSAAQYYVYTYVGLAKTAGYAEGQVTSARINTTVGIVRDTTAKLLYLADELNNRVRKVDIATGIVTTFAGSSSSGSTGDSGAATSATLYQPSALLLDKTNSRLYIADEGNNKVRVVSTSTLIITTFAGGGTVQLANSATALSTSISLNKPRGM
jgi:DNA-binding beta-propeller fold protein YncE